jgi:hypothetical protein
VLCFSLLLDHASLLQDLHSAGDSGQAAKTTAAPEDQSTAITPKQGEGVRTGRAHAPVIRT